MIYFYQDLCRYYWIQPWYRNALSIAFIQILMPLEENIEEKIIEAVNNYKHVIILCGELNRETVDIMVRNYNPKISYFTAGFIQGYSTNRWMDWFQHLKLYYTKHNHLLKKLRPFEEKPLLFDILLGMKRPHRDYVFDYINSNNDLKDKVLMTYYKYFHIALTDNENFLPEPDWSKDNGKITRVGDTVLYDGEITEVYRIIPLSIYNQTAYSLVAETSADSDYTIFTEKLAKPIIAQRLFIVIAGYQYLRQLRELGFMTFNGIIDEGYDEIPDDQQRYAAACEQMKFLSTLPQHEVLSKIKPIVEHNYNHLMTTNWHKEIYEKINIICENMSKQ